MRALLVETDHVVRDRVKVALQQFDGATVDVAEDAWALELAKENPYDLVVISDHLQEAGDGLRLLKDLRGGGLVGPAILLTRDHGDSGIRDRDAVNVSVVLTVPPDTVEIIKAIVSAMERVAQRR